MTGIKYKGEIMTELERYKEAYAVAMEYLSDFTTSYKQAHQDCHAILNPPPATEEVEVVRLMCNKCQRVQSEGFNPAVEVCFCHETGQPLDQWTYTELKGTYTRPVPQKVERSVSTNAMVGGAGCPKQYISEGDVAAFDEDCPFFSHPECHGKTGTLTFTWEE